jgi:hypothetical protein
MSHSHHYPAPAPAPYSSILLNDLHYHFPDLLYRSERFQTIQDVLGYLQERAQENPYERERRRYLASLSHQQQQDQQQQEEKQEAAPYVFQQSSTAYIVSPPSSDSDDVPPPPPLPSEPAPSARSPPPLNPTEILQRIMRQRRGRPNPPSSSSASSASSSSSRFRLSVPLDITSFLSSEYSAPAPPALQGLSFLQEFLQPVVVRPTEQQLAENTYVYCSDVAHNENCSICQDPMEAGQETRTLLACSHCFHRACIDRWFQENVRCPTCRRDVREAQE